MCEQHFNYRGVQKPKVKCLECWSLWLRKHPDEDVKAKDLALILSEIESRIDCTKNSLQKTIEYYRPIDPVTGR